MKILFFFLSLFFLTITQAQTINKPVFCGEQTEMASALEKLKEFPIWSSPSPVEKSLYIFYANRETGTWSLVQIADGIGCLVAYGEAGKNKDKL
jgi:hypothetical protein